MDESRLTEALRRLADEASPPGSAETVARRARRRLRRNVAVGAVCSLVLVAASLVGVRSLGRTSAVRPIEPVPSAPSAPSTPSTTEPSLHPPAARGNVVFLRGREDQAEIYVIGEDGSGLRRLTSNTLAERSPVWSPDHSSIAFVRGTSSSDVWEIWVMNAAGSNSRRLRGSIEAVEPPQLSWSPRGDRLAFTASRTRQVDGFAAPCTDLWTMRSDGRSAVRLLRDQGLILGLDWSPDGTRIVYGTEGGGMACPGPSGMFVLNADDPADRSDLRAPQSRSPSWSPDGKTIVFDSWRRTCHACGEIWLMNADGSRQRPLIPSDQADPFVTQDFGPAWASDGSRIVFQRGDSIWIANADGSGLRRLGEGSGPAW